MVVSFIFFLYIFRRNHCTIHNSRVQGGVFEQGTRKFSLKMA